MGLHPFGEGVSNGKFPPGYKIRVAVTRVEKREPTISAAERIIRAHERSARLELTDEQREEAVGQLQRRLDWSTLEEVASWAESPAFRAWQEAVLDIVREAASSSAANVFSTRSVPEA